VKNTWIEMQRNIHPRIIRNYRESNSFNPQHLKLKRHERITKPKDGMKENEKHNNF
jgi:hypothetical protein